MPWPDNETSLPDFGLLMDQVVMDLSAYFMMKIPGALLVTLANNETQLPPSPCLCVNWLAEKAITTSNPNLNVLGTTKTAS